MAVVEVRTRFARRRDGDLVGTSRCQRSRLRLAHFRSHEVFSQCIESRTNWSQSVEVRPLTPRAPLRLPLARALMPRSMDARPAIFGDLVSSGCFQAETRGICPFCTQWKLLPLKLCSFYGLDRSELNSELRSKPPLDPFSSMPASIILSKQPVLDRIHECADVRSDEVYTSLVGKGVAKATSPLASSPWIQHHLQSQFSKLGALRITC